MSLPAKPKTSKGVATRNRILAHARKTLIDEGYDSLVLRKLADGIGISLANLQYYFGTRDALLEGLIDVEIERDIATLERSHARHANPRTALEAFLRELMNRWSGEAWRVYATLNFLANDKHRFQRFYRGIAIRYYAALEEAIARCLPGLPREVYRDRARIISALIDGSFRQVAVGAKPAYFRRILNHAVAIALEE